MEMNFPHKSLAGTAGESGQNSDGDLEALIALAVTRQTLSGSARSYAARKSRANGMSSVARDGWMEDRIQFFANALHRQKTLKIGDRVFANGHFRPDLVRGNPSGETALTKV